MRRFTTVMALLVTIMLTGCNAGDVKSLMDPRPGPCGGSWFEGWYTRITDAGGRGSVAVIAGSFSASGACHQGEGLPGYVAILRHDIASGVLHVYEAFPERTALIMPGKSARSKYRGKMPSDFFWKAAGIGRVTPDSIDLVLGDRASLKAEFGRPEHWDRNRPWRGPEGLAVNLALLKSHWHVRSLASPTHYVFRSRGVVQSGAGFAHQEKNWGDRFPDAYGWAQGSSPDGSIKFVLGGGILPLAGPRREGWLLGVRSRKVDWKFNSLLPGTRITTRIDPCNGSFAMTAKTPFRTAELDISARTHSFVKLAVPTAGGFADGAAQSISATARIGLFRHGPVRSLTGRRHPVETVTIDNAALELGGSYRCNAGGP